MTPRFRIEHWAAWAPGLATEAAWRDWLAAPVQLQGDAAPPLGEMPPMMRRRIDPLGRVALQSAYWAQGDQPITGIRPVVFASRWGEMARSVALLEQLAAGEPLSPTSFSLSVHNAISALYSIARKDTANYIAVSAGEHSVEAAFIEALGLLADGAGQVLIVYFDAPLPECYAAFRPAGQLQFSHAWAALLTGCEQSGFSLKTASTEVMPAPNLLPPGLGPLEFLLGSAPQWQHGNWLWCRHAD